MNLNSYKFVPVGVALFVLANTMLAAEQSEPMGAESERLRLLEQAVHSGGIPRLLEVAAELKAPCPAIVSRYRADIIAAENPEAGKLEHARRDFGMKIAKSLSDVAATLRNPTTADQRVKQAEQLFDLRDWISSLDAYGNYFLVCRCDSLATVPLAYLAADLSVPMGLISGLRQRFLSEASERTRRVNVLNGEAPTEIISSLTGDSGRDDQIIEEAWANGRRQLNEWFKERGSYLSSKARGTVPSNLAFFLDDDILPTPITTLNSWEAKQHSSLVNGVRDVQIRRVDALILFREKVGSFPSKPPVWWKPSDPALNAIQAAFINAWEPYLAANGPIYSDAAFIYQQVKENNIYDYESQITRRVGPK